MGKILNALGLMKKNDHQQKLVEREDELYKEINNLRDALKEVNGQYLGTLNDLVDAREEIESLKKDLDTKKESLDATMMRNRELNLENAKFKAEIEDLKSDRYLRRPVSPDKTKSKNVHEGIQRPLMIHK